MNASVFVSMSDPKMALLINGAKRRVIVATPAVRQETAIALQNATTRLGCQNIGVVMDCDEEVFRLGYGELGAVKSLRESGCRIRQSSGLRVGVLVCDDHAWIFAPTALYVQEEVHSDETPNGIALRASDVERIVSRVLPGQPLIDEKLPIPADIREELSNATIEIGQDEIPRQLLEQTEKALEQAPPVAFNVARQVRVFEPYIQYVEISLRGCAIERHRIEIPKFIRGIAPNADLEVRLRTTFELIQKNSEISSEPLEKELDTIRDDFTRALGKPWGRVLLRNVRPTFDQRIRELKERLAMHKKAVEESLGKHLEDSRKQMVDYFFPLVQKTTPDALRGQITTSKPNDNQIRAWLDTELRRAFPKPDDLIREMTLDVQFRDVTFETLNEPGFAEKLKEEYEHVDWEKPFTEFKAARGRDSSKSSGNEE